MKKQAPGLRPSANRIEVEPRFAAGAAEVDGAAGGLGVVAGRRFDAREKWATYARQK
jgi:hypothetical protein